MDGDAVMEYEAVEQQASIKQVIYAVLFYSSGKTTPLLSHSSVLFFDASRALALDWYQMKLDDLQYNPQTNQSQWWMISLVCFDLRNAKHFVEKYFYKFNTASILLQPKKDKSDDHTHTVSKKQAIDPTAQWLFANQPQEDLAVPVPGSTTHTFVG